MLCSGSWPEGGPVGLPHTGGAGRSLVLCELDGGLRQKSCHFSGGEAAWAGACGWETLTKYSWVHPNAQLRGWTQFLSRVTLGKRRWAVVGIIVSTQLTTCTLGFSQWVLLYPMVTIKPFLPSYMEKLPHRVYLFYRSPLIAYCRNFCRENRQWPLWPVAHLSI